MRHVYTARAVVVLSGLLLAACITFAGAQTS
jgi:predicted small secreted protein